MILGYLTDALANFLAEQDLREQEEHRRREQERGWKAVYPSMLGKCLRQQAFLLAGAPGEPTSLDSLRRMAEGDRLHEKYQRWFAEMGILVGDEVSIEVPDVGISGRIDAIICHPAREGELIIVEIKSASRNSFAHMLKAGRPYPHYIAQAQLYRYLVVHHPDALQDAWLPEHTHVGAVILVENKDTQDWFEYEVAPDDGEGERLMQRAKSLQLTLERIEAKLTAGLDFHHPDLRALLPAAEYEPLSSECYFCPYFSLCWKEMLEADDG